MSERERGSAGVVGIIVLVALIAIAAIFFLLRAPAPPAIPGTPAGATPAGPTAVSVPAPAPPAISLPGAPAAEPPPELVLYRGEVSDALAAPIPGATITAGAVAAEEERRVTADDAGRFEIGLPAGERPFVRMEAPGHPRLVVELEREPRVPYLLFRGGVVRGAVTAAGSAAGESIPVAGARIEVAGTEGWSADVATDAAGKYSITAPQGAVVLTVRSPAHRDVRILDVEAVRDGETVRDIRLEPGAEVEAIVLAGSAPVAGASVRALTDLGEEASGTTDGVGKVVLGGLAAGIGRLVVVHPGYRAELHSFEIEDARGRVRRTVNLERCTPITLEVVDSRGEARPDASVRIRLDQVDLVTALAGDFHALQVFGPSRTYTLDVSAADSPRLRVRFRVPTDGPPSLRVVLPEGARFRGAVVDPRGDPVAGAGVLIISLGAADESWGTPQLSTTAVDGTFRSDLLAPGEYRVQVHHPHLGRTTIDTALIEGEDRDLGRIAFPERP